MDLQACCHEEAAVVALHPHNAQGHFHPEPAGPSLCRRNGAGRSRVSKGFSCLEVFLHLSQEQLSSSTSLSPNGSVISVGKALP